MKRQDFASAVQPYLGLRREGETEMMSADDECNKEAGKGVNRGQGAGLNFQKGGQ